MIVWTDDLTTSLPDLPRRAARLALLSVLASSAGLFLLSLLWRPA